MNIYTEENDFLNELRNWCKNNTIELPKDSKQKYGALKGEKLPESTKQILRDLNLGKKLTQETKNKISSSMKGIIPWNLGIPNSEDQRQKISNTLSKTWIITYPNGKTSIVKNLTKFCKENNLFQSNMIKVSQGKQKHHKGFICQPG
jgi:hypothetical protein